LSLSNYLLDVDDALIKYCSAFQKLSNNIFTTADVNDFDHSFYRLKQLNVTQDLIDRFNKTYTALQAHQRAVHPVKSNPNIRLNIPDDFIFRDNGNEALCVEDLVNPNKENLFSSLRDRKTDDNSPENHTKLLTPLEYLRLIRKGYEARTGSSSQWQDLSHAPTPPQPQLSKQIQGKDKETSRYFDTPPPGPGQPPPNTPRKIQSEKTLLTRKEVRRELVYSFPTESTSNSATLSTFSPNQESTSPADSPGSSSSYHSNTGSTPSGSMEPLGLIVDPLQNLGSPAPGTPEAMRDHSPVTPTLEFRLSPSSESSRTKGNLTRPYQTTISSSSSQILPNNSQISSVYNPFGSHSVRLDNEPSKHTKRKSPTSEIDGFLMILLKPLERITKAVGTSQSMTSNQQPGPRKLSNNSSVLDRTPPPPIPNPGSPKKKPEGGGFIHFLCGAFAPKANAPRGRY
jgi:hypothetical protein